MEKVSIIVPVYKVENYIIQCIDSILNQTYKNLEIILVDDGSPDKCPKICDDYSKSDGRIKVIHKPNGGLSSARNAGLEVATGGFIMFVDSDDFIEPNMVSRMMEVQHKSGSDVICCEINRFRDGKYELMEIFHSDIPSETISSEEFIKRLLLTKTSCASWNKLYRKEVIGEQRFIVGRYNEDMIFLYYLFQKPFQITLINDALYNYRVTPNSVTTSFGSRSLDYLYNAQDMFKHVVKLRPELLPCVKHYMNRVCIDTGWALMRNNCTKKYSSEYGYCKKYIQKNIINVFRSVNLPLRWKLHALILIVL